MAARGQFGHKFGALVGVNVKLAVEVWEFGDHLADCFVAVNLGQCGVGAEVAPVWGCLEYAFDCVFKDAAVP